MVILKKLKHLLKRAKTGIIVTRLLVEGGDNMDLMFAYLIQRGEMTIADVIVAFPSYYEKTVKRLEAMGFDENGQFLA